MGKVLLVSLALVAACTSKNSGGGTDGGAADGEMTVDSGGEGGSSGGQDGGGGSDGGSDKSPVTGTLTGSGVAATVDGSVWMRRVGTGIYTFSNLDQAGDATLHLNISSPAGTTKSVAVPGGLSVAVGFNATPGAGTFKQGDATSCGTIQAEWTDSDGSGEDYSAQAAIVDCGNSVNDVANGDWVLMLTSATAVGQNYLVHGTLSATLPAFVPGTSPSTTLSLSF
jgi:hypothetical protein